MDCKPIFKKIVSICIDDKIPFKYDNFIGGFTGLIINFERVINGKAGTINSDELKKLIKFIEKNKIKYEYVGGYAGIKILVSNQIQKINSIHKT